MNLGAENLLHPNFLAAEKILAAAAVAAAKNKTGLRLNSLAARHMLL
jgi:hypothetical protein